MINSLNFLHNVKIKEFVNLDELMCDKNFLVSADEVLILNSTCTHVWIYI